MYETENFVKFIKEKFTYEDIKLAKFIFETDLLSFSAGMDKVREGEKIIDKPTNILDMTYLKLCAKKFVDSEDLFEKIFLFYIGYSLREYKNTWRLNLNNLDADIKTKCSYCNIDADCCPLKLVTYIKKCISDNNFDSRRVFDLLIDKNVEELKYNDDENVIEYVVEDITKLIENNMDYIAAKMLLDTNSVEIINEEDNMLYYRTIDFKVKNNSFFNNLNDFYKEHVGIEGKINLKSVIIEDSSSYLFEKSPQALAAYIKYITEKNNVNIDIINKRICDLKNIKESEYKIAYFNQYVHLIENLECKDKEKKEIIQILTYIKNYFFYEDVPYIHFNIALYTENLILSDKIVNIINRFVRTFNYIGNKGIIWIDAEMLVKRTKDSIDTISQMERIYSDNDFLVFENLEKLKRLNEYKVDAFLTSIEKFNNKNKRSMSIFIENEMVLDSLLINHTDIKNNIINKEINIDGFNAKDIREKIEKRLLGIMPINEEFSKKLEKYIERTYNSDKVNEYVYIENIYNEIAFNKFKNTEISNVFDDEDCLLEEKTREEKEILNDINSLIGLTEVKDTIKNLLKYLQYTKKIDNSDIANLNMIFKGNSGTGKTTIARLLAELYYKLGFIKENKLVEVTSKDLIGTHLGETAPKTQTVIESALDGVLFIDEAYTIMSSRGGASSNYASECIGTLCKAMEMYKNRIIIIFAGYTKEMNDFINTNQGLMSRIGYEIEFPNFTKDELMNIFMEEVEKNKFSLEDGVKEKIEKIIMKNKIVKNFGNARFVINLFDKLVLVHAGLNEDEDKLKVITNSDIVSYKETKIDKTRTIDDILNDLNSLIGLEEVKETINGFVSVIELDRKLNREPDFNMHMIFKGNAGTGKTTVARLIAEIYYYLGYIKRNKFVEVQSQDLIGEFLGQTGPKTQAVIESALDGVLFIDEAYSIMEHNGSNASYSAECVATLLKAMEDYQGRLVIIFAGYTEEMRKFRDLNPGLKSRIGFEIDFKDYLLDELMNIFDKKIKDKGFKVDDKAKEKVKTILQNAKEVENFGNGRFVENMIQKIIIKHAMNTKYENEYERLITFTEEDVNNIKAEESKKKIGF